jgi:hypothetical protein
MTKRLILSPEFEKEISSLKKKLSAIAWENHISDETSEWLDTLCDTLGELAE